MWFEHLWSRRLHAARALWPAGAHELVEDQMQLEALAALAAWTERYDDGEWDDPPGKLALLFDLERIGSLLRDGNEPFHPDRDRRSSSRTSPSSVARHLATRETISNSQSARRLATTAQPIPSTEPYMKRMIGAG